MFTRSKMHAPLHYDITDLQQLHQFKHFQTFTDYYFNHSMYSINKHADSSPTLPIQKSRLTIPPDFGSQFALHWLRNPATDSAK